MCHRSGKRREKEEPEIFYFIFWLFPPNYISFQLAKNVPSFMGETWQDILIHWFSGTLQFSSPVCILSPFHSVALPYHWIQHVIRQEKLYSSRRMKKIGKHKLPWTPLLNLLLLLFCWQVNSQNLLVNFFAASHKV